MDRATLIYLWNGYVFTWFFSAVLFCLFWSKLRPKLVKDLRRFGVFIFGILLFLLFMYGAAILHPIASSQSSLWHFEVEQNIPSNVSTVLLLSVSIVAFRLILLPLAFRERLIWLIGALIYFSFALDEYWEIHERLYDLYDIVFPIVVAFFTLSIFVLQWSARGEARRSLRWLLFGILVSIVGAYIFDEWVEICSTDFASVPEFCVNLRPGEEMLEMLGTLFVLLGLLAYHCACKKKTTNARHFRLYLISLLILACIGLRYLFLLTPFFELKRYAEPVTVQFAEGTFSLHGYRFPNSSNQPHNAGSKLLVHIFMKAKRPLTQEFGHTFQLIDQVSGKVVANIDEWSDRRYHDFVIGRIYRFAQNMEDIANTPRNRALWLTLSLWQKNDDGTYQNYAISESAQRLLSESHAILTEFVLHTETETASTPALATFADGFTLHRANFPALAHAGTPLNVSFTWSTANDGAEDWTQFLHFVHEESGYFWNYDQPPLGARLPTRLWYAGLADQETWQFTLPADLPAGRYQLYTGLYRLSDLARMTVYDVFGESLPEARLPLGFIQIQD